MWHMEETHENKKTSKDRKMRKQQAKVMSMGKCMCSKSAFSWTKKSKKMLAQISCKQNVNKKLLCLQFLCPYSRKRWKALVLD